jgi:nucleotide-binding universal stress UspA family protein
MFRGNAANICSNGFHASYPHLEHRSRHTNITEEAVAGRSRRIAMYRHLLIATDGSDLADKAVEQGLALAKAIGARVTAVTVSEPLPALVAADGAVVLPIQEYEEAAVANATRILSGVSAAAASSGMACDTVHVKDQPPADGIVATAQARGADLIVMASHGRRGLSKLLLGSQANKVVTHSSVPVLVCR